MGKWNQFCKAIRGQRRHFWLHTFLGRKISKKGVLLLHPTSEMQIEKGAQVQLGNKVTLEAGALLAARSGASLILGEKVYINRNCCIVSRESIHLEDGVTIGPGCYLYDHDHDHTVPGKYTAKPIYIKKNAWIGANCVILKGVTIGEKAIVAAGTIVTKDVPDHTIIRNQRAPIYQSIEEVL